MARSGAPPSSTEDPGPSPGPARRSRLSGLSDSAPLLMFGGLAVVLGLYLIATHAPPLIGRVPLYAYLWTLGAIAIVGGLVASAVDQELDGLPGEGETVGDDLIVVRRSQWEELAASVPPAIPAVEATEAVPPSAGEAPPLEVPAPRPRGPSSSAPDWWEEALQILDERAPAPVAPDPAREADEVLETLADIERDSVPLRIARPPRAPAFPPSAPPVPPPPTVHEPTSTVPEFLEDVSPSVDHQLDEIDRVLDDFLLPGAARPRPRAPGPEILCVGCHRPLDPSGAGPSCESCNRPLCAGCATRSRAGHRPGLCPTCTMLLDGALGESG